MSEQSGNSGVRPEELTVSYRDASVHVKANGRLRTYVRSSRNAYSELAGQIREEYRSRYGRELGISRGSLATELRIHVQTDNLLWRLSRLPLGAGWRKLVGRVKIHTEMIDCGERKVDPNRKLFDILSHIPLLRARR